MGHSSIGVGGSRDGGSNRGVVRNHSDSSDTGDDSTVGQTSSHLANGVGAGLGFPLAIVDTVVKGGDSSGVADNRGGIVEGDPANLGHSGLGGVGDDTDVVKTTLSQGILGGGSSGDLGHGPGLGVSRDSHDGQAELKWVLCKILSLSETS